MKKAAQTEANLLILLFKGSGLTFATVYISDCKQAINVE